MTQTLAAEIVWEVAEDHLDEAAFLLTAWEQALDDPDYSVAELGASVEAQLLAHIDGLVLGGPSVGEGLLEPLCASEDKDPARITAAGLALIEGAGAEACERLLVLLDGPEARSHAICRALELSGRHGLAQWIEHSVAQSQVDSLDERLRILAAHNAVPGGSLAQLMNSEVREIVRDAVLLARFGWDSDLEWLPRLATHDDPEIAATALESALIRQVRGSLRLAAYWAQRPDCAFRDQALIWTAALADAATHQALIESLGRDQDRRGLLWALGFTGRSLAIDHALPLLDDPELAPLVGDLLRTIANMPRDDDELWVEAPEPTPDETLPPLEDDDLDGDPSPDPRALPIPEPTAARAWWARERARFDPRLRYLDGRVMDQAAVVEHLGHSGPMHRRHGFAFEIAARTAGRLQIPSRTFVRRQLSYTRALAEHQLDYQRPP